MLGQGKVRRAAAAAIGALALCAATATGAQAASTVEISLPADVVLFTPVEVTVSGNADEAAELIFIKHSSCDMPASWFEGEQLAPGPFTRTRTFSFDGMGYGSICVWLKDPDSSTILASASATREPRRAVASLSIAAAPIALGEPTTVTVSGSVDAPRVVELRPVDYSAVGCPKWPADWSSTDAPPLTAPGGTPVGPGPFTLTIPWTPAKLPPATSEHDRPFAFCAFLHPAGRLTEHEAAAYLRLDYKPPFVPPPPPKVVELLDPLDGASGNRLNPWLSWRRAASTRLYPVVQDVVRITRIEGEQRIPVLRMTTERWTAGSREAAQFLLLPRSRQTSAIAEVDGSSLRLREPLWPGTYEWTVSRSEHEPPAPRRFTVTAPPLGRVTVKTTRLAGDSSAQPLLIKLQVRTGTPFGYARGYRLPGGRWQVRGGRIGDGATVDWLEPSCRRPGGRIRWQIEVADAFGNERTLRGSVPNVGRATCARFKRREEAARRRNEAMVRRYKRNCEAIGGRFSVKGRYLHCRSASGRELRVPGF